MRNSNIGNGIIFRIKNTGSENTGSENSTIKFSESSKNSFTPHPLLIRHRNKSTPLDTIQEEKFIFPSLNLPENNNDFSDDCLRNTLPISLGESAITNNQSVSVLSNYVQNSQSTSNPENELFNQKPDQPNYESKDLNYKDNSKPSISPNSANISQNCCCQIS